MLPKFVDRPKLRDLHPTRHLKTVFSLFLPTIAISIYTVLDKTMIGIITNDSFENGYYEQAIKMSKVVLSVVTALGVVMIPRIGHYFSHGDTDAVRLRLHSIITRKAAVKGGEPECIWIALHAVTSFACVTCSL